MSGELHAVLSARMLGSLAVTLNGTVVDTLSSRRTRHLLAYLLLRRRAAIPRDVLMDTFWPTASPEAARNSLHVALSGVRQALRLASPVTVLQRRHDTYRLAADVTWVDSEELQRQCTEGRRADRACDITTAVRCYSAADQLYEGDLLRKTRTWAGCCRNARRCALRCCTLSAAWLELYAANGDNVGVVLVARRALSIDPYDEAVHRQLMLAYGDVGQLHLALARVPALRRFALAGLQGSPLAADRAPK